MSTLLLAHGLNPVSPQHVELASTSPPDSLPQQAPLAEESAQPRESAENVKIPLTGSTS